jgi:hypothetical protein
MPASWAIDAIHQDHMMPFHQAEGEAYLDVLGWAQPEGRS